MCTAYQQNTYSVCTIKFGFNFCVCVLLNFSIPIIHYKNTAVKCFNKLCVCLWVCVCAVYINQVMWHKASKRQQWKLPACEGVVTMSWLVYSPTGPATLWHVMMVQQLQRTVAKPVGLEKTRESMWEGGRERKWPLGKMKSNFLFPQQPREKHGGHTLHWQPLVLPFWVEDLFHLQSKVASPLPSTLKMHLKASFLTLV